MNICEQANEYFRSRTGEEAPKKRPAPIGFCLAGWSGIKYPYLPESGLRSDDEVEDEQQESQA